MNYTIPAAYAANVRIGTCSWKYGSWSGLVYPAGRTLHVDEYLPFYAEHFSTVEIDQWFWSLFPTGIRMPDPRTVARYAASVPDDFVFTVKAPNSITLTHYYARQPADCKEYANKVNPGFLDIGLLKRFLNLLEPLEGKLGPVMFQFEYLNKKKMASLELFLQKLNAFFKQAPAGFRYAVEIRNPNFCTQNLFRFLEKRGIGFVFLDGYYMPPLGEVFDARGAAAADFSVIRLHGVDRKEIEQETGEQWNRIVAPKPEGLAAAARIVRANTNERIRTFVNINNHYEGSAPLTIERFITELERQ